MLTVLLFFVLQQHADFLERLATGCCMHAGPRLLPRCVKGPWGPAAVVLPTM